ncbi:hypothetical protein ACIO14_15225 [Nocardia fluminea]|uniref:hypothetical protein n=1 Tax=Nocardia fluminea TaxID=134984 RepID=UPI0038158EEF
MSTEHGREPIHDPIDLLDELDSIILAQEMLRHRTVALQARYAALEPIADRFDQPHTDSSFLKTEYGAINVQYSAKNLGYSASDMEGTASWLRSARELAEKVREYPQPQRSVDLPEVDRRRSR